MDTENPSAPSCAESRNTGKNHSRPGGLTHENVRHTTRFTVIGNHLAQHRELSLLAIGLGVHIQSLPKGARVDIKSLTARFPEGSTRIAAGLRELEAHGYLRRERSRVRGGRMVTRTVSCNQPGRHDPRPAAAERAEHAEHAEHARDAATPAKPKKARGPRKPLPAVPRPAYPAPALLQAATDLLAGLRRYDSALLLSACDTAHLAPGVAAWLERDVSRAAVCRTLTADLPPEGLRRPAAFLAHRLTALLPPPPPFREPASPPPPAPGEMRNCDGCDRGIRSPEPDARCRDCRERPSAAL
jgi:hypothetical protein